jgi:hypothetical protein
MSQRTLNYEYLSFQDQFNAVDGYTFASAEVLPVNNFGFLDFGLGLTYSISPNEKSNFNIGGGIFHLLRPDISFYSKNDAAGQQNVQPFKLNRRINVHAAFNYVYSEFNSVEPRALFMNQGLYSQIMLSNLFKFKIRASEGRTFYFGPGIRAVNNQKGFGLESLIAMVGMEYKGLLLGFSYDHHFSDIVNDNFGFNTFEFSIQFLGEYENEDAFCPTF